MVEQTGRRAGRHEGRKMTQAPSRKPRARDFTTGMPEMHEPQRPVRRVHNTHEPSASDQ